MPKSALFQKYEDRRAERKRLRQLGIQIGTLPTGKLNAITDVAGVKVGHLTLIEGTGKRKLGTGPIRTGVTVISPMENIFNNKLLAGGFILNGAGEMAGMIQVNEWGLLETPIALTNTMSVGTVGRGIAEWLTDNSEDIQRGKQVVIPVVGECDDSFLNDSAGFHIKKQHVLDVMEHLSSGPVIEGAVGAGTGMVCCDLKGGIGTSSRIVKVDGKNHHVAAMVLSNFGNLEDLRVDGLNFGQMIEEDMKSYSRRRENYGSIIVVLATDLPLSVIQIQRLCKRAALGIGRVGSYAAHGSGEIIVGFSTANIIRTTDSAIYKLKVLRDDHVNVAYQAAVEATEESILNALCMGVEMEGIEGNRAPALPLDRLLETHEKVKAALK